MKSLRKRRRSNGASLAELPAALYLLFIGLFIPFLAMVVMTYRVGLVYFAVRDAASQAAISQTFTLAKAASAAALAKDSAAFSGISIVGPQQFYIVIHQITDGTTNGQTDGTETTSTTKLTAGTVDTSTYVYFYRTVVNVSVAPWFGAQWMGIQLPGLTAPYTTTMHYEEVVESTAGLTS